MPRLMPLVARVLGAAAVLLLAGCAASAASFEPSYIDWLASTITRDRELVAYARVIRDELDRQGVTRRTRTERSQPERSA